MKLLAVETSTPLGSLSLIEANDIKQRQWEKAQSHSEIITLEAQQLITDLQTINGLAVGIGPGSFTGVRVGINFVRSLAYALNIKITCLNSLELLALPALLQNDKVFCLQSAFRNLVYVAQYEKLADSYECKMAPRAITVHQLDKLLQEEHLVVGLGFDKLQKQLPKTFVEMSLRDPSLEDRPQSSSFQLLQKFQAKEFHFLPWNQVVPLYIRASEAEEKLRQDLL